MGIIVKTFKQKYTDFILHTLNNWRTSLIGILAGLSVTAAAIAPLITHHKTAVGISIFLAAARVWQGLLMKDPGVTSVTTPENPTPHSEPSTEVPLNPDATIVK